MTPPENEQPDNKPADDDHEKTVQLKRCPKHGLPYLPSEGCPECNKEKNA
ncbi:MAG: hypothetical protein IPM27_00830 [Nitrosomonadales bacterium]|nr:hypothetical protein [Nitrosomonadales bacterium]